MPRTQGQNSIVEMEVTGGFLAPAKITFGLGLICLLGESGTGKTTLLELIRFALGLERGGARGEKVAKMIKKNLGTARVRVAIRTSAGARYTVERVVGGEPVVLDESGKKTDILLASVFGIDVYSYQEIEETAEEPELQLALLDRFLGPERVRIEDSIADLIGALSKNAAEMYRLDLAIDGVEDRASREKPLARELEELARTGDASDRGLDRATEAAETRAKVRRMIESARKDLDSLKRKAATAGSDASRALGSLFERDLGDDADRREIDASIDELESLESEVRSGFVRIDEALGAFATRVRAREERILERHRGIDADYRTLVERSKEESERAAARAELHRQFLDASTAAKTLAEHTRERERHAAERRDLLVRLDALRGSRSALRKEVAKKLTDSLADIRITIKRAANREGFRNKLIKAFEGTGARRTQLERIAEKVTPEAFVTWAHEENIAALTERTELGDKDARAILESLRTLREKYDIETLELADQPSIELRVDGEFVEPGSAGQKCASIFPVLLEESDRPLLIDQPEDNIGGRFLAEVVAPALRRAKERRQLIFATHAGNIAVLPQADRLLLMSVKNGHAAVEQGTVESLKAGAERLLEGGNNAFVERGKTYGHSIK